MNSRRHSRRKFLDTAGRSLSVLPFFAKLGFAEAATGNPRMQIATNTYPWLTFARRANEAFRPHADRLLNQIAATGIHGYEPIIESEVEFDGLAKRLETHGLHMKSIYVNSTLHDERLAKKSVSQVIAIARLAKGLGTQIVVTNPAPIRWGGPEDKTDDQLRFQAKTLNQLGAELLKLGVTLAYHNHDAELRQGGREFHHMLTATDSTNVKLCLDAHWIFRGCGDSEVAVFDALAHYHHRIVELHLRQSRAGTWTESFDMNGDINYVALFEYLKARQITPHLVLEQAVEEDSPKKLSVVDAHRISRQNLEQFAQT